MENLPVRFVFDRKKQAGETKKGLLQIEVRRFNLSQRVMISTGIRLYKNQFSDKNGFTCRNHDSAMPVTGKARRIFRQIEAFALSGKCIDIEHVKNWDKNDSSRFPVVDFMREQLRKSNPTPAISRHHSTLIGQVEHFGKIKTFVDITYSGICEFDEFLKQNGVRENSTLNKRHSTFRRYIKKAVYMDLCKKDPYVEFNPTCHLYPIKKPKTSQKPELDIFF